MTRKHDEVVEMFFQVLRSRGHRVATEVGVPGGRIDLVRLDDRDQWVELYEVKLRLAETGLRQLETYARHVAGTPKRTLVLPPHLVTADLLALVEASGSRVEVYDYELGVQLSLADDYPRRVFLPYIHPESVARIVRLNRATAAERRQVAA